MVLSAVSSQPASSTNSNATQISPTENKQIQSTTSPRRTYTCRYCHKVFFSSQSVAGHTNIHVKESTKRVLTEELVRKRKRQAQQQRIKRASRRAVKPSSAAPTVEPSNAAQAELEPLNAALPAVEPLNTAPVAPLNGRSTPMEFFRAMRSVKPFNASPWGHFNRVSPLDFLRAMGIEPNKEFLNAINAEPLRAVPVVEPRTAMPSSEPSRAMATVEPVRASRPTNSPSVRNRPIHFRPLAARPPKFSPVSDKPNFQPLGARPRSEASRSVPTVQAKPLRDPLTTERIVSQRFQAALRTKVNLSFRPNIPVFRGQNTRLVPQGKRESSVLAANERVNNELNGRAFVDLLGENWRGGNQVGGSSSMQPGKKLDLTLRLGDGPDVRVDTSLRLGRP